MSLKLAVYFCEEEIAKHDFKCVLCGATLDKNQALSCYEIGDPPCCEAHEIEVEQEVDNDMGMWPNHWHGGAWKTDAGDWRVTITP